MLRHRIFEQLEDRLALAGNVVAAVVDGVLQISGDSGNNSIELRQTQSGELRVSGRSGTQINGSSNFSTDEAITAINVDLKEGNDTLTFQHLRSGGDLSVDLGPGNDRLLGVQSSMAGNLSIAGGDGKDWMLLNRVNATGALTMDGGAGNDMLAVHNANVEGEASILGGDGRDNLVVDHLMASLASNIDLGAGRDRLLLNRSSFASGLDLASDAMDTVITRHVDRGTEVVPTQTGGDAVAENHRFDSVPGTPSSRIGHESIQSVPAGGQGATSTNPPRTDRFGHPITEQRYQQLLALLGSQWFSGGIGY